MSLKKRSSSAHATPPTAKPEDLSPLESPGRNKKTDKKTKKKPVHEKSPKPSDDASGPTLKSCLKTEARSSSLGRNVTLRSLSPGPGARVNFKHDPGTQGESCGHSKQ